MKIILKKYDTHIPSLPNIWVFERFRSFHHFAIIWYIGKNNPRADINPDIPTCTSVDSITRNMALIEIIEYDNEQKVIEKYFEYFL